MRGINFTSKTISCFLFFLLSMSIVAQTDKTTVPQVELISKKPATIFTQTIRGQVIDQSTGFPLIGATVSVLPSKPLQGTTTNADGYFELKEVAVGRYRLKVSFIGYEDFIVPELLVTKGKQVVQNVEMIANPYDLETITIAAMTSPSAIYTTPAITVEKTRRFPATFFDPARVIMAYPGVINTNDQANNMTVRGNSPNGVLWRLEGVDIVNPNHLSNAGTFDDRATQNGGGVNILSAQMLDDSRFLMGALPADFGNVQSGIMDMRLRDGNNEQSEFMNQIGLIGVDFAAEAPLGKGKKSSYLANYRFSTIGLLSALGVQLGDEDITFQDLSFKLSFPLQKSGKLSVFGFGGLNSNVFQAERDSTIWEFEKDRQDIRFDSKVGALGINYHKPLSDKVQLKVSSVYSIADNERSADILKGSDYTPNDLGKDNQKLGLWSSKAEADIPLNPKHQFKITTLFNHYDFNYFSTQGTFSDIPLEKVTANGQLQTVQSSLQWLANIAPSIGFNAGVNIHTFVGDAFNRNASIEPRFALKWQAAPKSDVVLAYGQRSQMQLFGTYFSSITDQLGNTTQPNEGLDFTKSRNYSLAYTQQLSESQLLRIESYYQDLYDVPISQTANSFSALNLIDGFVDEALVNGGTGENYGVEVSLEKFFSDNWYYLVGGTWYESKYVGSDGIKRDTRFNGNYNFNLTTGKEFPWHRKGKDRVLSINAAFTYAGGFRDTPIDVATSMAAEKTIYQQTEAFTIQMEDYYKMDLRVAIRRNKASSSRVLALDIQNVSNHENIAFQYFDVQKGEIVTKRQLGIIPILSWRIEF
ncbi:MAG: TonB-dependent receptor [Chitinophagales bacterium]